VQKLSGDAAAALRPAHRLRHTFDARSRLGLPALGQKPQTYPTRVTVCFSQHREAKARQRCGEDHYTPEKFRMECVGKTFCAATESAACRKTPFLKFGLRL